MSKGPQRIRGTQDIWGEDADRFNAVVAAFDRVRRLYAFQRVEMPVFEATEVFARSIGETTDIVSKEMYTFPDRGGDLLTLRPEFTAGICRAYLSEGWQQHAPIKLATHGPVFRYERPQKGRFRQFHQLDAEIIGTDAPAADVELLVPRRPAAARARHFGRGDARAQHARRRGDARRLARALWSPISRRIAATSPRRASSGSSKQPAAHPRQQGAAGPPDRRGRARDRRFPDRRGGRLLRAGHRRPRRRRRRLDAQPAPRARPRLLPPHRLRIRHRPARRARRGDRRRPL